MDKLISAILLLIALAVVLAAATPAIVRLLDAVTPLVLVVGVLFLAWTLLQRYLRQ
jgi:hypothetical protein